MMPEQLSLWSTEAPVSVEAPARTSSRHAFIETVLRHHLGPRVVVSLTDNRSTMISLRTRRSVHYVRLHRGFSAAPLPVLEAVACYLGGGRLTPRRAQLIDRFIDGIRPTPRADRPVAANPRGEVHDLARIFAELNQAYFDQTCQARITWSRASRSSKRRTSIRLGSYCEDLGLIRIHPALDQDFVPEFFVASVVHHEMLHEKHGLERTPDGRRIIHSRAFRAEERRYPDFARARIWERRNIQRLLRY